MKRCYLQLALALLRTALTHLRAWGSIIHGNRTDMISKRDVFPRPAVAHVDRFSRIQDVFMAKRHGLFGEQPPRQMCRTIRDRQCSVKHYGRVAGGSLDDGPGGTSMSTV